MGHLPILATAWLFELLCYHSALKIWALRKSKASFCYGWQAEPQALQVKSSATAVLLFSWALHWGYNTRENALFPSVLNTPSLWPAGECGTLWKALMLGPSRYEEVFQQVSNEVWLQECTLGEGLSLIHNPQVTLGKEEKRSFHL